MRPGRRLPSHPRRRSAMPWSGWRRGQRRPHLLCMWSPIFRYHCNSHLKVHIRSGYTSRKIKHTHLPRARAACAPLAAHRAPAGPNPRAETAAAPAAPVCGRCRASSLLRRPPSPTWWCRPFTAARRLVRSTWPPAIRLFCISGEGMIVDSRGREIQMHAFARKGTGGCASAFRRVQRFAAPQGQKPTAPRPFSLSNLVSRPLRPQTPTVKPFVWDPRTSTSGGRRVLVAALR